MKIPSRPVTPQLAAHIRYMLEQNQHYQQKMAALLNVNSGRITDVKKGRLHPGVPAARGPFPV